VVSFAALEQSWRESRLKTEREHVTQYIRRRPDQFRMVNFRSEKDRSSLRWTVDHREDLKFVLQVVEGLARRGWPGYHREKVLRVVTEDGLRDASDRFHRDEGLRRTMKEDGLSGELV
jgi:spore coat polysaccharide biosynthesis protein SpsF